MTTVREELIADWRKRLAAAEATPLAAAQRLAWLVRVRIRLYRLLLSLYGDGNWNAAPFPPTENPPTHSGAAAIFDSPEVLHLAGKPPKSAGQIRTVLQALAKARDQHCRCGPLVDGLPAESWVAVATASAGIEVGKCRQLLTSHGLDPRVLHLREDDLVEVAASERSAALRIIAESRDAILRPPPVARHRAIPTRWSFAATSATTLSMTIPLAWLLAAAVSLLDSLPNEYAPLSGPFFFEHFFTAWRGLFVIALLLVWRDAQARNRLVKARRQTKSCSLEQMDSHDPDAPRF